MKPARILTATVALAVLSTLGLATTALAGVPKHEHSAKPVTRPADQTHAQRTLQRTLAREHHAYPARTDQQTEAAKRTIARTLAREQHTYPAATDRQQASSAQQTSPGSIPPVVAVVSAVGLTGLVAAAAWRRQRARSRPRQAT